jgi:sphingosine kinase
MIIMTWSLQQNYLKVSTLRVTPTGKGYLSVDGEAYPFEPFELQIHTGIIRFLSLDGYYNIDAFFTSK